MKLTFRSLAILAALLFFCLAFVWMFAPNLLLSDWGVEFTSAVAIIGRRASALYAGIGVMFFAARNAEPSTARSALSKGFMVACLMLAVLGVFELTAGYVKPAILIAVAVEIAFTLGFLYVGYARPAPSGVQRMTSMQRKKR
jgi:hypothetical protein